MRIAICDDDINDRSKLNDFIHRYDGSLVCDLYSSAVELINALKTAYYELIFLDIEMEKLNGFNAAKLIMGGSDKPLIIFVTHSSKYTIQGYEVAFRYLVKPITYENLEKVLKAALERILPQKMPIDINGKTYFISLKEIYYFEVLDHKVRIHTNHKSYDCRYTLKNIEDMLSASPFIRPHNSFLVNMEHVVSASQAELTMRDELKISISRKKKDEVLKAIHEYLRR